MYVIMYVENKKQKINKFLQPFVRWDSLPLIYTRRVLELNP